MEPKHLAKESEGMVAACWIKSNLLFSLRYTSLHPFIHLYSLPHCTLYQAFLDFFCLTHLTAPPPSSAVSMSLPAPGTRSEPCCPFINLSLSFFLSCLQTPALENCEYTNRTHTNTQNTLLLEHSSSFITPPGHVLQVSEFLDFDLSQLQSRTSSTFLSYVSGGRLCPEYFIVNQRNAAQAARLFVRERRSHWYRSVSSQTTGRLGEHPVSVRLMDTACLAYEKYLWVNMYRFLSILQCQWLTLD